MTPNPNKNQFDLLWFLIVVICCVCYYCVVLSLNEVPQDEGDGLIHFSISQDSWTDITLFLSHWGKPLFILFSSGFAQLGFEGFICFNIVVFALSCLVFRKIAQHYNTQLFLQLLFPVILITIPDYSNSVIGGMTEPFFGLLLLLLFWTAVKEQFFWFAIICSFTPFARSEGMLVVIAAVPYLFLLKKWKYIPLLAVGFIIYAIVGEMLIDQPMWYFENNPYSPISIYGSGPWYAYLISVFQHLGLIPVLFLPFTLLGLLIWKSKKQPNDGLHILFFSGIYIGIIVIHSYLWANGLRGALGLTRLATLGLLPFLAIQAIAVGFVFKELHRLTHAFSILFVLLIAGNLLNQSTLPIKASPQQLALKKAVLYLGKNQEKAGKIYYFNPLITHFQEHYNKWENQQYQPRYIDLKSDATNTFKPGDLIVRDSKFGNVEQGLQFKELKKYPWIIPVKHFYADDINPELNGEPQSVIIYQVMDKNNFNRASWDKKHRAVVLKNHQNYQTLKVVNDLFYTLDTCFRVPALYGPKQDLEIIVQLKNTSENPVYLVFESKSNYYLSIPLTKDTKTINLPFINGNVTGLLYIHNPNLVSYQLTLDTKSWTQTLDTGLQPIK